ncbi:DUF6048 family protein [Mesonia maritima]|uniref:Uncharacterized protein n=1 Tax=Mesonia maritima TaxID=1793873 RepID=A0ABU1K437_9FLAO|nr:DUF6048 family protein [Mesonia maritima]MDR6300361.1 hypothetical protein [Mesonia maritima]
MKTLYTYIFTTSIFLLLATAGAAQIQTLNSPDSLSIKETYGLRVGLDLAKPIRSLLDEDYSGFEINGDYRIYKNYYVAGEIGGEDYSYTEPYLDVTTNGTYIKIGANYNTYTNWLDMQNELYAGLRYGFASFTQTLHRYKVYTTDGYFDREIRTPETEFGGLTHSWVELQLGIKAEVLPNVFLAIHAQLKRSFGGPSPTNFANLYIPGFHRTYDNSDFGVGWGYSISYLIPFFKKAPKKKEEMISTEDN